MLQISQVHGHFKIISHRYIQLEHSETKRFLKSNFFVALTLIKVTKLSVYCSAI